MEACLEAEAGAVDGKEDGEESEVSSESSEEHLSELDEDLIHELYNALDPGAAGSQGEVGGIATAGTIHQIFDVLLLLRRLFDRVPEG